MTSICTETPEYQAWADSCVALVVHEDNCADGCERTRYRLTFCSDGQRLLNDQYTAYDAWSASREPR